MQSRSSDPGCLVLLQCDRHQQGNRMCPERYNLAIYAHAKRHRPGAGTERFHQVHQTVAVAFVYGWLDSEDKQLICAFFVAGVSEHFQQQHKRD